MQIVHTDKRLNTAESGKWQTRPLVRESAPYQQACNCLTVIKIWSYAPDGCLFQDGLADWPSVVTQRWLRLWLLSLDSSSASRGRRRKGTSRIWDSKIWSRVPWDSDSRMTELAWASSNCKRQTRPLVRETAPHQQTRNSLTLIKIWS
jgi:hypothetical protein